jgi:hypothetical protein
MWGYELRIENEELRIEKREGRIIAIIPGRFWLGNYGDRGGNLATGSLSGD